MACCLFITKPLSETMLILHQQDHQEQFLANTASKYKPFHSGKINSYVICEMLPILSWLQYAMHHSMLPVVNTLRPRQNGRRFADDTFKRIFLNENVRISITISLKFVPKGPMNNNPSLFQIMACRLDSNKPLSEPMMVSSLMHICVTRPQWVKQSASALHSWTESLGDRWFRC